MQVSNLTTLPSTLLWQGRYMTRLAEYISQLDQIDRGARAKAMLQHQLKPESCITVPQTTLRALIEG